MTPEEKMFNGFAIEHWLNDHYGMDCHVDFEGNLLIVQGKAYSIDYLLDGAVAGTQLIQRVSCSLVFNFLRSFELQRRPCSGPSCGRQSNDL